MSYHQGHDQLRKRRLWYYTTGYSATVLAGSSVTVLQLGSSLAAWFRMFYIIYVLRFMFHTVYVSPRFTCFTPTKGLIIDYSRLEGIKRCKSGVETMFY